MKGFYKKLGDIYDLEMEVVYTDLCCYCGACGAFCQKYIMFENQQPTTKKRCDEACGLCYDFCPRSFFSPFDVERTVFGSVREDNALGYHKDVIAARATDENVRERGQDGGVVSALLIHLLNEDEIDSAVVTKGGGGNGRPNHLLRRHLTTFWRVQAQNIHHALLSWAWEMRSRTAMKI